MAYTTIDNAAEYFQTVLYTGNETNRTITFDDTDANTDPDMVWIKARNDANSHELFDSVRGGPKRCKDFSFSLSNFFMIHD